VYIKLTLQTISERLGNIKQRGVVLRKGQTLKMLYEERCPLYEKYAHITVDGENLNTEELMENIKNALKDYENK
jgi:shikimate kinase